MTQNKNNFGTQPSPSTIPQTSVFEGTGLEEGVRRFEEALAIVQAEESGDYVSKGTLGPEPALEDIWDKKDSMADYVPPLGAIIDLEIPREPLPITEMFLMAKSKEEIQGILNWGIVWIKD